MYNGIFSSFFMDKKGEVTGVVIKKEAVKPFLAKPIVRLTFEPTLFLSNYIFIENSQEEGQIKEGDLLSIEYVLSSYPTMGYIYMAKKILRYEKRYLKPKKIL